jgi:hypothetical protein
MGQRAAAKKIAARFSMPRGGSVWLQNIQVASAAVPASMRWLRWLWPAFPPSSSLRRCAASGGCGGVPSSLAHSTAVLGWRRCREFFGSRTKTRKTCRGGSGLSLMSFLFRSPAYYVAFSVHGQHLYYSCGHGFYRTMQSPSGHGFFGCRCGKIHAGLRFTPFDRIVYFASFWMSRQGQAGRAAL